MACPAVAQLKDEIPAERDAQILRTMLPGTYSNGEQVYFDGRLNLPLTERAALLSATFEMVTLAVPFHFELFTFALFFRNAKNAVGRGVLLLVVEAARGEFRHRVVVDLASRRARTRPPHPLETNPGFLKYRHTAGSA